MYVAAIDQGTTGTRGMLFDRPGTVTGEAYRTHEQYYPRPGWVEHDPAEIWAAARECLLGALADAGAEAGDLAAIGVANQRETTVLWDAETGEAVHRALVWQDGRTADRAAALAEERGDWIRSKTGLEPDAYFSATKLEWLLEEVTVRGKPARERAAAGELRFGTVDAWLLDRLTGGEVHATDVTNAARTMLFDVHDLAWDDELLAEFDVPRAVLPSVRPSVPAAPYGHTDPDGFLGAAVPVAGALGDQQAALFGQACFEAGEAKTTYGTGAFLLGHTGTRAVESERGLLTTLACQRAGEPARYALEGSVFVAGAALEWLADLGVVESPAATAALAREVESTDGVYFVPAFAGLGAPHWDGRTRGTVVGLTRGTDPAHLARAALEGIAFRVREVVEAMAADGPEFGRLRADGGGAANDALCALQADALGAPVVRPAVTETTALGAAFAAGLAVGYWDSQAELRATRRVDRTFEPEADPAEVDRRFERWGEAVDRARDWAREE